MPLKAGNSQVYAKTSDDTAQLLEELASLLQCSRSHLIHAMIQAELDRPHFLEYLGIPRPRLQDVAQKLEAAAPQQVGDSRLAIDNIRQILGLA
jgi:hypothetical protein